MQFESVGAPLALVERDEPEAGDGQIKLKVEACAVCRTDLHLVDGEVAIDEPPRILGHQIVGRDEHGARFGVPWLGWTCGECRYCTSGRENLCPRARFTGCDIDGGFADHAVADRRFAFALPEDADAVSLAPLLCGGLIGYRALRMCGDAARLGIYGFGAAAHLITQVAVHQGREVYAFTRAGDEPAQRDALALGAVWAGASEDPPPEQLEAAIIFAPVGPLVPLALAALAPGGVVVCGGIHMSDIPSIPYAMLWQERQVRSVANLTRLDATEFLELAPAVPVVTKTTTYPLERTNEALDDLRNGRFTGSAVVVP
jgi:propanol-preferring alcohol dehydrogenase